MVQPLSPSQSPVTVRFFAIAICGQYYYEWNLSKNGVLCCSLNYIHLFFVMASWLMDVLIQGTGAWGRGGLNFELLNRLYGKHGVQIMSQNLSWSALVYFICINQTVLFDAAKWLSGLTGRLNLGTKKEKGKWDTKSLTCFWYLSFTNTQSSDPVRHIYFKK